MTEVIKVPPGAEDTKASPPIDYAVAEGLRPAENGRDWTLIGLGLTALFALMALVVSLIALAGGSDGGTAAPSPRATTTPAATPAADKPAPTLADSKGIEFEKFQQVDPNLPAVPPGAVKRFNVDVMQHVTQVSPDLAPTEAWTYVVNGSTFRGTAASKPLVVNQGDKVEVTFLNGGSKTMAVTMPHSIDFHSAEVAPSKYYVDVEAGKKLSIDFVAKHPGV
ncbi:MAG: hypothetical protein QOH76_3530, partial [Thermoleophilaceae bacterium]|nr:hypothetical protein [Thermoleophilaceae bacterium]